MATKTSGSAATAGATAKKGGASAITIDPGAAPANIAGATEFDPSGAPRQTVDDVDPSHPSVDDNPRANTTIDQNRIDFNDPVKSGQEIVSEQLGMTKPSDAA